MTPTEFRDTLKYLRLTQVEFARRARVTPKAVQAWASGKAPVPGPVVALLTTWKTNPFHASDAAAIRRAMASIDEILAGAGFVAADDKEDVR